MFCIGLRKTGTVSLAHALRALGLTAIHDQRANGRRLHKFTTHWGSDPFRDADAYLDTPFLEALPQLRDYYQHALFIHTHRPREDWITSNMVHVLHNRLKGDPWRDINTPELALEHARHAQAVTTCFARCPERLLSLDVTRDTLDRWGVLCRFLQLPRPAVPFPHLNAATWRLQQITKLIG